MPFHGFADWEDCIAHMEQREGVDDPEAVCGKLKAEAEGKSREPVTRDEMQKWCPPCAAKMTALGITKIYVADLPALLGQQTVKVRYGIVKTDDAQRLVFGWASVSQDAKGQLLEDLQGDVIEPDELEKAAYDFVMYGGGANEMHRGRMKGQIVESFLVTPEKLQAMGVQAGTGPRVGWWIGLKLEADAYAKVQSGVYKMFSIKGHSEAEELIA